MENKKTNMEKQYTKRQIIEFFDDLMRQGDKKMFDNAVIDLGDEVFYSSEEEYEDFLLSYPNELLDDEQYDFFYKYLDWDQLLEDKKMEHEHNYPCIHLIDFEDDEIVPYVDEKVLTALAQNEYNYDTSDESKLAIEEAFNQIEKNEQGTKDLASNKLKK